MQRNTNTDKANYINHKKRNGEQWLIIINYLFKSQDLSIQKL